MHKKNANKKCRLHLWPSLECPPPKWRIFIVQPSKSEDGIGAQHSLAHLLPKVHIILSKPNFAEISKKNNKINFF